MFGVVQALMAVVPWAFQQGALDERALVVLEEARRVAANAGEELWPDFAVDSIPIALFQPGERAYLVGHPEPPPGFEPLETELVSTAVFVGPWAEVMNANTSGPFGGAVCAFIGIPSLGDGPIASGDVALVVHEVGHAFCDRAPGGGARRWAQEDSLVVSDYPVDSAVNNAWGRIEGAVLRDALESEDAAECARLAEDFLSVRNHRQASLEPEIVTFEKALELNEGLAEYFALRALALAGPDYAPSDRARERGLVPASYGPRGDRLAQLERELGRVNAGGRGANRQRFYSTGAALGLLLDRLAPGWKAAVEERGRTLQEVLAEAVGAIEPRARADRMGRIERIGAARGFEELLRYERSAARAAGAVRRSKLLEVLAAPERKLVLDLSMAGGVNGVLAFDPMNLVAIAPDLRVHTRMLRLGFERGEASFDRPVVQDLGRALAIAVLPADVEIELDLATGRADIRGAGIHVACVEASWLAAEDLVLLRPGPARAQLDADPYRELFAKALAEAQAPLPAAPFQVTDLTGTPQRLPAEPPRATALVFFSAAAWARPGQRFVRELLEEFAHEDLAAQGARLLVVASQCDRAELEEFLGETARSGIVHDADRTLAGAYGVELYPTVTWIDADCMVASRETGYSEARLRALVSKLKPD